MSPRFAAILAVYLTVVPPVIADPPVGSYIFPAGARRGTTIQVHVGGLNLHSRCGFELLGPGVTADRTLKRMPTLWFEGPILPLPESQQPPASKNPSEQPTRPAQPSQQPGDVIPPLPESQQPPNAKSPSKPPAQQTPPQSQQTQPQSTPDVIPPLPESQQPPAAKTPPQQASPQPQPQQR